MARRWRTAVRWISVAMIVLTVHLVILGRLGHLPDLRDVREAVRVIEVRLLAPPAPPTPAPPTPVPSAPVPQTQTSPPPPRKPITAQRPTTDNTPAITTADVATAPRDAEVAQPSASSAAPPPTFAGAPDGEARFDLPQSLAVRYDTYVNGIRNQNGHLHWITNGQSYTVEVATQFPFLGEYVFRSTGRIDAYGLAPDVYTEVRGRRGPATATFSRHAEANAAEPTHSPSVLFSRHTDTTPLTSGMQDRFSVFMQMVGLLRGSPERYATPGTTLPFSVVDTRGAEAIQVQYTGDESVTLGDGTTVMARHFMRLPRHAGDQRVVEVWLAASLGWMPARLRQTEPNGLQFEFVWSGPESS